MLNDAEIAALVERLGVGSQRTDGVLIVDDERHNLTVLRGFLEERWRVHEAASGAEALAIAEATPLDVVITDQRMPGMSGVDLLERLKGQRPDVAGIVLTAYSDVQAVEAAINRASVFRYLRKPWEPNDVLAAVEQASAHVGQRRTIEKLVGLLARRSEELRDSLEKLQRQQELVLHLERLSTIGQLSSGVTHDLKNVIVAFRTVDSEIAGTGVPEELRDILRLGLSGVDNLLRTLRTLHDFARNGSLALQLQSVDPRGVLSDATAISRMDPLYRLRRVQCDVSPELPQLRADRQKLTQVLVNMVRNALHATENGGLVRVAAGLRDAAEVVFTVEDDGPGLSPEVREKLFEPFVSDKGDRGLGLGLYMARLIVESHRGRIEVSDRASGGARFDVVLPLATACNADDVARN